MERGFEKISYEQFTSDIDNDKELYEKYKLPRRSTSNSAGYDFFVINDLIIKPGEIKTIPTGIKSYMNSDEMLLIVVRSSTGFKFNTRLCNQVGVIDSDYYNNLSNEGHIWVKLENHGTEDFIVNKDNAFVQGIFNR